MNIELHRRTQEVSRKNFLHFLKPAALLTSQGAGRYRKTFISMSKPCSALIWIYEDFFKRVSEEQERDQMVDAEEICMDKGFTTKPNMASMSPRSSASLGATGETVFPLGAPMGADSAPLSSDHFTPLLLLFCITFQLPKSV
ncbi:uncharacterized protein [Nothobranchius furzeri]|uniref:uncharacterized protein isoform X2 n=1 Tax=Nothobranchius furzeri TaxID=105023 RepID=UPI0039046F6B